MFSRLSSRGVLAPVTRNEILNKFPLVVTIRGTSETAKHLDNWDKANKIYYGPERDHKNFPILKQPVTHQAVRLGFIPESWFQIFYEKTGVTGPYMFGIGALTFLLSKEYWVVEHGFTEFMAFWAGFYLLARKLGKPIGEYLEKDMEVFEETHWRKPLRESKAGCEVAIKGMEKAIWCEDGQKYLFEAKKENVDLQLESAYRQRISQVHQQVKKALDYQAEVESTKRKHEQNHMVNWIVSNVVKSITPQQERDSISKCLQDLKGLQAARA